MSKVAVAHFGTMPPDGVDNASVMMVGGVSFDSTIMYTFRNKKCTNRRAKKMSYYTIQKNIEQYIQMAEGYDGKLLIEVLGKYLPEGATVLELGMGPGKDLLLLDEKFSVTGSDVSPLFLERFKASNPDIDLLQLDAVTMKTDRKFDCIYSNKVLYHLTQEQLTQSLKQQLRVLKPNGLAHHSFWYGEGDEEMQGLHFTYYTEEKLQEVIGESYDIVEMKRYTEMDENDSIYILLRQRA